MSKKKSDTITCRRCGKKVERNRDWQLYCSRRCKFAWHKERRARALELLAQAEQHG